MDAVNRTSEGDYDYFQESDRSGRKNDLHVDLLVNLTRLFSLEMDTLGTFRQKLKKYLDPVVIKESKDLVNIFDSLENKGYLAVGRYDALIDLFSEINEKAVQLIKQIRETIDSLDAVQILKDEATRQFKYEGKEDRMDIADIWKDYSAEMVFNFKTSKKSVDFALQRYAVGEFENMSIFPEFHAVYEPSIDDCLITVRAASPLFYKAFCNTCKECEFEAILNSKLESALNQIYRIHWLEIKVATIDVKMKYKKNSLTEKNTVDCMENTIDDCRNFLLEEVHLQDLKPSLVTCGVMVKEMCQTITSMEEVTNFVKRKDKIQEFKNALIESGHRGSVRLLDGTCINELFSDEVFKVHVSVINHYDQLLKLREINIRELEMASKKLKQHIDKSRSKQMKSLLKEILVDDNFLHAFMMALNNTSNHQPYKGILRTLIEDSKRIDKEHLCNHKLKENTREGELKNTRIPVKLQQVSSGCSSAQEFVNPQNEDQVQTRIRTNYSQLLTYSMLSIRKQLVECGIISQLTYYLIEEEIENKIKTDMVLKSVIRSEPNQLNRFLSILQSGTDELRHMGNIIKGNIGDSTDADIEGNIDESIQAHIEVDAAHIKRMKMSIEKHIDHAVHIEEYLEVEFLHPFFEQGIITIDKHDEVFHCLENRHHHLINLVSQHVDNACKTNQWIRKYTELMLKLEQKASGDETDENEMYDVEMLGQGAERKRQDTKEIKNGCILHITGLDNNVLPDIGDIAPDASTLSCFVKAMQLNSIEIILQSPSSHFYEKLRSACERNEIKQLLLNVIKPCVKASSSTSKFTADVNIEIIHQRKDFDEKVTVLKDMGTMDAHKLYDCRKMLIAEIWFSDIERPLRDGCVIDSDTLDRIINSTVTNQEKMEAVISCLENESKDTIKQFIKAIELSGYKGIAKILDGSYLKDLKHVPVTILQTSILDNYKMLIDEIDVEELKEVSVQIGNVINRLQTETKYDRKNILHLLLRECLLDDTNLLQVFFDSLTNHVQYHHILKRLEDSSLSNQDLEDVLIQEDKYFVYTGKIVISNKAEKPVSISVKTSVPVHVSVTSGTKVHTSAAANTSASASSPSTTVSTSEPMSAIAITSAPTSITASTQVLTSVPTITAITTVTTPAQAINPVPTSETASTPPISSATASTSGPTANTSVPTSATNTYLLKQTVCADITQEESNYLKLITLVLKIAPRALRQLFDDYHMFSNVLMNKLNRQKKKEKRRDQREQCVIENIKSEDFDMTFNLMLLLLNTHLTDEEPITDWNKPLLPKDGSKEADIARIKFYSNKIVHCTEFSIANDEFHNIWSDLSQAVIRLGGQEYVVEVNALLTCALDSSYKEHLERVRERPELPVSLQCYKIKQLAQWETDDKSFYETRAAKDTKEAVLEKKFVLITGAPGVGKSAITHHIALDLNREGYKVYPVKTVMDIVDCWSPDLEQVFVLDDPFGVHCVDETKISQWNDYKDVLEVCLEHSNMKIIGAVRLQIHLDEKVSAILSEMNVNVKTISVLSGEERVKMFKKHASIQKREDLLHLNMKIVEHFSISCFPLLCRIYTANRESEQKLEEFFNSPSSVCKEISQLKEKDPLGYFCLLLCMIYDSSLPAKVIQLGVEKKGEKKLRKELLESCELLTSTSRPTIKKKMDTFLQTFVKLEDETYQFVHDVIQDAVITHVNSLPSSVHKVILKHCSSKFMRYRVHLSGVECKARFGDGHDAKSCINIMPNAFSDWALRVLEIIRYGLSLGRCTEDDPHMLYDNPWRDVFEYNPCVHNTDGQTKITVALGGNSPSDLNRMMCTPAYKLPHRDTTHLYTALHWAVEFGLTHIVTQTLSMISRAEIRQLDSLDPGLLCWACKGKCDTGVIQALIDGGVDINTPDEEGLTPLYWSVLNFGYKTTELFLSHHADIKHNVYGLSPLYVSIYRGDYETTELLLSRGADANQCDKDGRSVLYHAVNRGDFKTTQLLLSHLSNLSQCDMDDDSLLCLSVYLGNYEITELLLSRGADANQCDEKGRSCLYHSVCHRDYKITELLLSSGADANQCDEDGRPFLYHSVYHRDYKTTKLLLSYGANANQCGTELDMSFLYMSVLSGDYKTTELLLSYGANVNEYAEDNESFLCLSVSCDDIETIKLLLSYGADINQCDTYGKSALFLAQLMGRVTIAMLLESRGAICMYKWKKYNHITDIPESEVVDGWVWKQIQRIKRGKFSDIEDSDDD